MFCSVCGNEMEENAKFCSKCGTPVEPAEPIKESAPEAPAEESAPEAPVEESAPETPAEESVPEAPAEESAPEAPAEESAPEAPAEGAFVFCPHCGTKNNAEDLFCASCGGRLDGSAAGAAEAASPGQKADGQKAGGFGKKGILIGIAAAAVILILAIVGITLLSGKKDGVNDFYYVADNELYEKSFGKGDPKMVDDGIVESGGPLFAYYDLKLRMSDDGKYLFYPRNYDSDTSSYDLYCVRTDKKNAEAVKVASDMMTDYGSEYALLPGNRIVYLNNEGSLYLSDFNGEKERIAKDAREMVLSKDGSQVVWLSNEENRMYFQDLKKKDAEKERLDSNVTYVQAYSDDLKTIVYMKDNALYVIENLKDKKKISEDVENLAVVDINGKYRIYYVKQDPDAQDIYMWDLVEDDLADSDAQITEPDIEDYQHTEMRQTFWGVSEYTVTDDDAYYAAYDTYREKLQRDYVRDYLKGESLGVSDYFNRANLMVYDSEANDSRIILKDKWVTASNYYNVEDSQGFVSILAYLNEENLPKIKLSTVLAEDEDESDILEDGLSDCMVTAIQSDETIIPVEFEGDFNYGDCEIDYEKKLLYILLYEMDEDGIVEDEASLVSIPYTGSNAGKVEEKDTEVGRLCGLVDGKLYYLKDCNDSMEGDLYCDNKRIDSDVSGYVSGVSGEPGKILYRTEYDDVNYTLKLYDGKESKKIGSDVYTFEDFSSNKILFLTDYSTSRYEGELKLYNGKEVQQISSDVSAILRIDD